MLTFKKIITNPKKIKKNIYIYIYFMDKLKLKSQFSENTIKDESQLDHHGQMSLEMNVNLV